MVANTYMKNIVPIAMRNNSKAIRGDQRGSQARGCQGLGDRGSLFSRASDTGVSEAAKSDAAVAAAITRIDAHHTAHQTQITGKLFKLSDRVTLLLLQHLIKLSRRETAGLFIPLEWYEGDEEIFQVLMELIRTLLHLLAEEGFERFTKIFDVVVEALNSDGFDGRAG